MLILPSLRSDTVAGVKSVAVGLRAAARGSEGVEPRREGVAEHHRHQMRLGQRRVEKFVAAGLPCLTIAVAGEPGRARGHR